MESYVNNTTKRETFMVQKTPKEVVERIRNHRGFSTSTKKWGREKIGMGKSFLHINLILSLQKRLMDSMLSFFGKLSDFEIFKKREGRNRMK